MRTFGKIEAREGTPLLDEATVQRLRQDQEESKQYRRMLDQQRLDALAATGFTGPTYHGFSDDLWQHALPILKSKMRSGEIFTMCSDKNVVLDPTSDERAVLHSSIEDRDALAVDTIAAAIRQFRVTLMEGGWKPSGGASVETYFIGACVLAFGDVFRKWARTRRRHLAQILQNTEVDTLAAQLISKALDPEQAAVTRDTVEIILRKSTPQTRMICALIMRDIPFSEIAEQIGITERAVEGKMRRLRLRVHRMIEQGSIDTYRRTTLTSNAKPGAA